MLIDITTIGSGEHMYDANLGTKLIRWDFFDNEEYIVGSTVQIANVGFYADKAEAMAVYTKYIETYNLVCGHDSFEWTYISDDDESTYMPNQRKDCLTCGEKNLVTRVAPYSFNIEGISGCFTAKPYGQTTNKMVEYKAGCRDYPTDGYITLGSNRSITVKGWGGVSGCKIGAIKYQVVDATTGEVLKAWSAVSEGAPTVAEAAVNTAVSGAIGTDTVGCRFTATASLADAALAGKTVNVTFVMVPAAAMNQSDNLIPFVTIYNVVVPE